LHAIKRPLLSPTSGGDIRALAELAKKADIKSFSYYLTQEYLCDHLYADSLERRPS
jgi:hypothetical protein